MKINEQILSEEKYQKRKAEVAGAIDIKISDFETGIVITQKTQEENPNIAIWGAGYNIVILLSRLFDCIPQELVMEAVKTKKLRDEAKINDKQTSMVFEAQVNNRIN